MDHVGYNNKFIVNTISALHLKLRQNYIKQDKRKHPN